MKLVAGLVFGLVLVSGAARAEPPEDDLQSAWAALLADAAQAEQRSAELAAELEARTSRWREMDDYEIRAELEDMDPALLWGFAGSAFKALRKDLKKSDPRRCLAKAKLSKACKNQVAHRCRKLQGHNGLLRSIIYTAEPFDVDSAEIESYQDYLWAMEGHLEFIPETVKRFNYEFCRAIARSPVPWSAFPFSTDSPEWFTYGIGVPLLAPIDQLTSRCGTQTLTFAKERALRALIDAEVLETTRSRLQSWLNDAHRTRDACRNALDFRCDQVSFVRDVPVLTYCTAGGRIREVTEQDIRDDARMMDTEASGLRHLQLVDQLRFCAAAKKAGFGWRYNPPVKKGCKPERD